ncbi:nitronate monooxygenase family protein [Parasphingopyxis sp.]|uniref:NAD(P)H-dependent flavin oxidoreductase n=1 Tax=Parasphingopyxis sp. TaxID=1920299 RepID=UPI002632E57C|nr:nitronate monooxygenase family protein [Parasphingopyxis sp.]
MMNSPICSMLNIEFPLLAFSHCRDVVAAVSKAGGMGVFGAVGLGPDRLREELDWIDTHVDGKPYGLDLIVPNKYEGKGRKVDPGKIAASIPDTHTEFVNDILADHDIDSEGVVESRGISSNFARNLSEDGASTSLEVGFEYPIKLVANALGVPPQVMLDMGKQHGVPVAALVGAKEHAVAQVNAGVDILVVAGGEAGGHCGDVSTMVLIPEVARAVREMGADTPILAAGGITTGEQMAAAMAMGAAGAWCGSVWLTTAEAETNPVVKEKMLAASSRDTVRSRSRTGKPSRQLRSPWTDAWEAEDAPKPLPMPMQSMVSEPALKKIDKLSQGGHEGAKDLATYWVGQGVGLMNQPLTSGQVVQQFKEEFVEAYERLSNSLG